MSKIIIVDENDNPIGFRERMERGDTDIARVTGLCVYNAKREVLIAQRVFTKRYDPGKWGPAVSGTVEEGETYESNIIKEAMEEIGLPVDASKLVTDSHRLAIGQHHYFRQMFYYQCDWPIEKFKIEEKEVAQIRWINIGELAAQVKEHPENFIASFTNTYSIVPEFAEFLGL